MRREVVQAGLGIGGGQALILLAMPLLGRVYSPEQFGLYASVMALAGVFAAVSSLRLDASVPAVPEDDVSIVFHAGLFLPFVVCPLAVLAVEHIALAAGVLTIFEDVALRNAILLVALFQGIAGVILAYCTRAGWFGRFALIKFIQPAAFAIGGLLVFSTLHGALAISWFLAVSLGIWLCRTVICLRVPDFKVALGRHWRFPILSVPMTLLDSLAVALPITVILEIFGSAEAGNYSQVQRIIGAPVVLAGLAVAQVFYKGSGDRYRKGESMSPLFKQVLCRLGLLAVLILAMAYFGGKNFLHFLLGEAWNVETDFLLLALLPVVARGVASPVSSVFLTTNRLDLLSYWQISYFAITIAVLFVASNWNLITFLTMLAISEVVLCVVYVAMASRVVYSQGLVFKN